MSIWDLYKKPVEVEGKPVEGLNARYYTGYELSRPHPTDSFDYIFRMGVVYSIGLVTYFLCTKYGMRAQRMWSSLILVSVPAVILGNLKGDDNPLGQISKISLEERLTFYPITRRALERAIADVSNNK